MNKIRFILPNGLRASIIGLEDDTMTKVLEAGWPSNREHTISTERYLVLVIRIKNEAIHFVYHGSLKIDRQVSSEFVQEALVRKQWDILDEAYFIFYNETAYWTAQAFKIIKQSIQRKVTPKIFALLSPQ